MSEQKLISPLLDGFAMGNPMSEHDGIRCCPAIKENTDKKYIVKIISIPASQTQMDALLLAGAYRDAAGAMDYFREIGEGIIQEAELLKKLSRLDGFLPYEGWQMEPITRHRLGYEVYLVGSYKRSLDKYVRKNPVTHLEAVNLGLDLCSALSVCRQAGSLYVALKPSNIFLSEKKQYRIGDLGFIPIDAMRYTALPKRYFSAYTPPELYDPMAPLNLTIDTYAVGMILYQLYNEGRLPFKGKAPEEALPSPVNADYELAEIIMKAIHPDPEQRWTDPRDMGKALALYMQKNTVNDVPITPYIPLEGTVGRKKKRKKKAAGQAAPREVGTDSIDEVVTAIDAAVSVETAVPALEAAIDIEESVFEAAEETPTLDDAPELASPEVVSEVEAAAEEEGTSEETPAEEAPVSEEPAGEMQEDEPGGTEQGISVEAEAEDAHSYEVSEELSRILAKAGDLLAHETPEGVIVPELPEEEDPFAFVLEDSDEIDDSDIPVDPLMEEPEEAPKRKRGKKETKFEEPRRKRRIRKMLVTLALLPVFVIFGLFAYWYYQFQYLQTINSITIDGDRDQLTVTLDTNADEALLTITCSDNYGNVTSQGVVNGQASFTGLQPNTMYEIQLNIEGFHKLVGKTSDVFTTDATTSIVSFTSVAGSEDGSVMLNFTVDGDEPEEWTLRYSAEGEEEKSTTFTGHSIAVDGLSVGKVYTFTLDAGENLSLSGEKTLELMASRLVLAEDLSVTSSNGSDITIRWNAPGDLVVDSWDVRCYSDVGYDEQATVTETEALFTGIDPSASYTIEVTASGMTQPARTSITANPISIQKFDVQLPSYEKLDITWEYTGEAPEEGWLLMYTIDGNTNKNVVKCAKASASIAPAIPGAKYDFTVQAADTTTIFNSTSTYTCPEAEPFEANALSVDMLTIDLLKTPEEDDWYYENVSGDALTDTFASGDGISIVLRSSDSFYLPGSEVDILYVIRDAYGNVLPEQTAEDTMIWKNIWTGGDVKNGELDIPKVPTAPGKYVLDLYFDGMRVAELSFTITE